MTKISHQTARIRLANQRQMTSLLEKEMIAFSTDLKHFKANRTPLYIDRGNKVTSDCGTLTAYRAISMKGQLHWMVFSATALSGYLATASDPFEAMLQAQQSQMNSTQRMSWTVKVMTSLTRLMQHRAHPQGNFYPSNAR